VVLARFLLLLTKTPEVDVVVSQSAPNRFPGIVMPVVKDLVRESTRTRAAQTKGCCMAKERFALVLGLSCMVAMASVHPARAEERVVDQLLEILRQNKQITEQQYRDLKRRADEERQQDLHRAGAPAQVPLAAAPAPPAPPPAADTMRAYFKNGFNFETVDGNFKLNIGGRAQLDWNISDPGGAVKRQFNLHGTDTGVEFRRARLSIAGLVYNNIDFKFEYDFADGTPAFKDVYMGISKLPLVQYLRVGHFKEPFSLEEVTSDDFTTFQERATMNAFAPDRNTGFAVMPAFFDQRTTVQAGAFRETDNFGKGFGSDQEYNITARVTGLPWYVVGQHLLHLGLSYTHKFRSDQDITFSQRPESHLFPASLVNTQKIKTGGVDAINPEIAFALGPVSVQGEYTHAFVAQVDEPDPQFGAFYVEGSYFLTGESRAGFYRTQFGYFDRVIPIDNFSVDGKHWGAWQLVARFSRIDLDSKNVEGGTLDDVTAGVNWYLNPNTRVIVNYVWAHLESVGDSNLAEGRFQLSF
jgi:phosphate-selective porin OprO and OprP